MKARPNIVLLLLAALGTAPTTLVLVIVLALVCLAWEIEAKS